MSGPYVDLAQLEAQTSLALDAGHRLFHTHRLSPNDTLQAGILLEWMDPPAGALVLDAGCGVGELARLMAEYRPDLSFLLANISRLQLEHCPVTEQLTPMLANCHALPLEDASVDAVMFVSALVQMDAPVALAEAARVLRPGGVVFLAEMVRDPDSDGAEFEAVTSARVLTADALLDAAAAAGLELESGFFPHADDAHFRAGLRELGKEPLMDPIRFVALRFIKR